MRHYHQIPDFTDEMEEHYALVYWDQRSSGNSSGNPDESTLNLNQFAEDLDHLLTVLAYKYGDDIDLFLMGQSFGGMLGSAFLTSEHLVDHNIAGWISVGGVHSFIDYSKFVIKYGAAFLNQQTGAEWDRLRTKLDAMDSTDLSLEQKTLANSFGYEMQEKARDLGVANPKPLESLVPAFFFGNYNPLVVLLNHEKVNDPLILDISELSFTDLLSAVNIPALYLHGEFDFVAPAILGQEAFNSYGGNDKAFHVLSKGSHNILATNPEESKQLMIDFINNQ